MFLNVQRPMLEKVTLYESFDKYWWSCSEKRWVAGQTINEKEESEVLLYYELRCSGFLAIY